MRGLALLVSLFVVISAIADEPPQPAEPQPYSEMVEVTASRVEQPLLDAPVAMSVIDRQQIETTPADNYADLLRGLPGVNVIQTSARDVCIRTRGATTVAENSQLVLLDGRSVYLDYYGLVIFDYLPVTVDELESVEVQRGPGSAVWGSTAMSGVINLRTRPPRDLAGGLVTATAGEQESRSVTARFAQVLGPWSYKLSSGYFEQEPWPRDNLLPDGTPFPFGYSYPNAGTRQPRADVRVDRELADSSVLSLRGGFGGTSGIVHTRIGPFQIQPGAQVDYADVDYTRGMWHVKAYSNHLNGDAPSLLNGLPFSFENRTSVLEMNHRSLVGRRQMLVYGATARENRFDLSIAPDYNRRRDYGMYLEDIFEVSKSLEINAGARLDWFDTIGVVVSPRLSVILKPAAGQAIRLAANRAYRAPTLLENYISTNIPNVVFLADGTPFFFNSRADGNLELERESLDALEVGWSAQAGPFFLSAAAYQNTIHDNVVFVPVAFFGPSDPPPGWQGGPAAIPPFALIKTFSFLNVGTVRNRGLELSVNARFRSGWSGRMSYTWQDDPKVSNASTGVPLFVNKPPRSAAGISADRRADRWFGSASVTYTGRAYWSDVLDPRFWGYSDAYTLVNGSLGVNVTRSTELVVAGTNLLDRDIKQHVFGDIIGRKISIEVRQRF